MNLLLKFKNDEFILLLWYMNIIIILYLIYNYNLTINGK